MQKSFHVIAMAATLCLAANVARALPINAGAMQSASDEANVIEKTAVYIVEGHRYCFYFDGWHGPGWYRCGFAFRRGFGWGGVYGWRGWEYGPAARRFGRDYDGRRYGDRERTTIRENRRYGDRERGDIRERGERSQFREGRERGDFQRRGERGDIRDRGERLQGNERGDVQRSGQRQGGESVHGETTLRGGSIGRGDSGGADGRSAGGRDSSARGGGQMNAAPGRGGSGDGQGRDDRR